ncbi:MAG: tyrosine-protein phosphatase [Actinobacteria bacterium]|nr:tyrosine-protein phosphatase [Actinomycetota bacterium]
MIETGGPPGALAGAFNFRDVGGLPTEDGRRTRAGVLFRSDSLAALDGPDVALLRSSYRIGRVIDLRTPVEMAVGGGGALSRSGVEIVNFPVRLPDLEDDGPDLLVRRYFEYLSLSPGSVVAALERLGRPGGPPTVVHCTSGKDRTGVVIALLLRLVGVSEEAVVADYRASAPNMLRLVRRLEHSPYYGESLATLPPAILRAEEETMRTFLRRLDRRHGGARGWARAHGIRGETVAGLEQALLEPPGNDR